MSGSGRWDVIVAGAGPAGCHAAWELGRRGRRVLLLDRHRFPRWKPCAGGITAKAEPFIPDPLRELFEREIREAVIAFGPGLVSRIRTRRPVGWLVHRETFDRAHLELVRGVPGVEVLEGCPVEDVEERASGVAVTTPEGRFDARAVIGADGVESVVRRFVAPSRERRTVAAFEGEARPTNGARVDGGALFDLEAFPGGYGWVFPKRDRLSIGGLVEAGPGGGRTARGRYEGFVSAWSAAYPAETYRSRGYRIPLGGALERFNGNRVVLVGDAADAVDPVTGEGIAFAFMTAHLAAGAVEELLARDRSLDGYTTALWRRIHGPFVLARRLADVLYAHPRTAFRWLFRNRLVCGWFVAVVRGEMGYPGLLARVAAAAPVLPAFRMGDDPEVVVEVP